MTSSCRHWRARAVGRHLIRRLGLRSSFHALADAPRRRARQAGPAYGAHAGNSLGGWSNQPFAPRGRARSLVLFHPAGAWRSHRSIEARAAAITTLPVAGLRAANDASRADAISANSPAALAFVAARSLTPVASTETWRPTAGRALGFPSSVPTALREIRFPRGQPLPADRTIPCGPGPGLPLPGAGRSPLLRSDARTDTRGLVDPPRDVGHVPCPTTRTGSRPDPAVTTAVDARRCPTRGLIAMSLALTTMPCLMGLEYQTSRVGRVLMWLPDGAHRNPSTGS